MNTNDKMQLTSSASRAEMSKEDVIVLAMAASAMSDRKVEQALEVLQKEAAKRSAIVPQVVQAPTDRQILDFASYAYNRGGLSVGFTDVAALDKFREIVGVAAPIVATVPSEPTLYQSRMRPMWRDAGQGWTVWEDCSKASYESVLRLPNMELNDWQYEARKLFDHAAPSPTEQASDVRNAALEEVACALENEVGYNDSSKREFAAYIRALKSATPADKGNAPVEAKP